jgi:hypothetical protein
LNRYYLNPSREGQPTVWAAKQAIVQAHETGNMLFYIDLHAHPIKRGCFLFGNSLQDKDYLENVLFARLIAMNSLNFDFMECSFSQVNVMKKKQGDRLNREGSGRAGAYRATGMPHCYTLECNYASG